MGLSSLALSVCAVGICAATAVSAQSSPDLFKGKTINVLIGYGPGGGYDAYGRVLANYLGKHVPGTPAVVAKNMPGAGSMKVANYLYNASPKDGTDLGVFATSIALEPLFGGQGVQFETTKYTWVGNMSQDASNIGIWKTSPVKTWEDMRRHETVFGATGPAATSNTHIRIVSALLNLKTRIINGFQGTKDANLAMQRGELDGYGGLYVSTIKTAYWQYIQNGDMKIILQLGRQASPELGDAPSIFDLVKTEDDRLLAAIIFDQDRIGRPIAAPPGLPEATTLALRRAFLDSLKDPELLATAAKAQLDITPQSGEEVQTAFAAFYAYPDKVVQRAKTILER